MKNIQFVTAVHGNEPLPTLALVSAGIEQVVANPRAIARGVRFTEHDLNASFGTNGAEYEKQRARQLLRHLDPERLVIDFHTFSCESEPFAILVDLAMLPVAASLGVKRVVYMKHNIKGGHSLINHRQGVSVEVGKHSDPKSFGKTLEIVRRLKIDGIKPAKVSVYEVYGRIEKKGEYINFEEKNGIVPVLYEERAYDGLGFYGLAAREITGTI
ncbi:MAG: succinylglutamate desuccinylase/aspartoacylase family protein [bacterium]